MTDESEQKKEIEEPKKGALLTLANEAWRFSKIFTRAVSRLEAEEQSRYVSQYRYFLKQLESILSGEGYRFVNLEGHPFDPGMAVTALNLGDFSPEDGLVVDQMIEPVIMGEEGLVKTGTVLLRKVGK
jgi:hypothetical protein